MTKRGLSLIILEGIIVHLFLLILIPLRTQMMESNCHKKSYNNHLFTLIDQKMFMKIKKKSMFNDLDSYNVNQAMDTP